MAPTAARERLRVARSLGSVPLVVAAFGAGRLSYSKVRAITRVATPDNEAELVSLALTGTAAQVERIVRGYRRVRRSASGEDLRHERRYLHHQWDDDGSLVLRARLGPEEGALVLAALEAARETAADASGDSPAGTSDLRG